MNNISEDAYDTEVCTCGEKRKDHNDNLGAKGHGGIPGKCVKYTWNGKSGPFAVARTN